MNNKGFTLIELLAVILILVIITVIAVPITTRYIDQSHIEAAKTSANVLLKSAQDYYSDIVTETGTFEYQEMTIAETKGIFNYTGKLPDAGYITIDTDSSINVYYVQYNYCIIVSSSNETEVTKDLTKCGVEGEPELSPDYVLNDIVLDGVDDYYDTGYSLFKTNQDFTIIASFTSNKNTAYSSNSPTLFHCMREASPYPGVAVDQMNLSGRLAIKNVLKPIFYKSMYNNKNVIAIRRNLETGKLNYFVIKTDGTFNVVDFTSKFDATNFDQNLLVGAYQDKTGVVGRFFEGTVYTFRLYMQALDDETIENILNELNK